MLRSISLFFFQAEDGIRVLVRSRGLGDVYKRQALIFAQLAGPEDPPHDLATAGLGQVRFAGDFSWGCLLYTSDAADERSSVDLGGRRIIKKKKPEKQHDVDSLTSRIA